MRFFYLPFRKHTFNNKHSLIGQSVCINISICADMQGIWNRSSACCFLFSALLSCCPLKTLSFRLFGLTSWTCNYISGTFWLFNFAYCAHSCVLFYCELLTSLVFAISPHVLLLWYRGYYEGYSGREGLNVLHCTEQHVNKQNPKHMENTCSLVWEHVLIIMAEVGCHNQTTQSMTQICQKTQDNTGKRCKC